MHQKSILSPGRRWEEEFFGVTDPRDIPGNLPEYLTYSAGIEEVLSTHKPFGTQLNGAYEYDPSKPKSGPSRLLWQAVRKHLPPMDSSTKYGLPQERLYLYITIGCTSLDYHHGVDAFFWWRGVHVSLDTSVTWKKRRAPNFRSHTTSEVMKNKRPPKSRLKADYLVMPATVASGELIGRLGSMIAHDLKAKQREQEAAAERSREFARRVVERQREAMAAFRAKFGGRIPDQAEWKVK